MLYLLEMLNEDDKFRNDKELIKHCEEEAQEMYEHDVKMDPSTTLEDCKKIPMFEENQFLYDTKTGKLYKAEKYIRDLLKKTKK